MSDITKNVLQEELNFFEQNKKEFLKTYKEQFVLIKGKALIGSFTTEQEAYNTGVSRFDNMPFLIKQVLEEEQTASIPALTAGVIHVGL